MGLARDNNQQVVQALRPNTSTCQQLSLTASSQSFSAVGVAVSTVRLCSNVACRLGFGGAATTTSTYLPAGVAEYFAVTPGDVISALQDSGTGGILSLSECP